MSATTIFPRCPHCRNTMSPLDHGRCSHCGKLCGCSFAPESMSDYCDTHRPAPRREDAGDEKPMDYLHPLEMHHARREDAAGARDRIGNEKENAVIQRARDEINRICVGRGGMTKSGLAGRQWTMSIPVRDDDSDQVFAALVDLAFGLQVALSTAERGREALRAQLAPCGECHLQPNERCDICGKVQHE